MKLVDPILQELEREAVTTRRVLECVPEGQLGWKPHEKSMSLGTLALHMANIPGAISRLANSDGLASPPNFVPPEATSSAQILEALDTSLADARTWGVRWGYQVTRACCAPSYLPVDWAGSGRHCRPER